MTPIPPIHNSSTFSVSSQKKSPPVKSVLSDSISPQKNILFSFPPIFCWLSRCHLGFTLLRPFEFIYRKFMQIFDALRYAIARRYEIPQLHFAKEQLAQMQKTYWRLGGEKWKEGVELPFHKYGWAVFDLGLHGRSIEPGFNRNWERAAHFLSTQFQKKVDAKMYLNLHRIACSHFMEDATDTVIGAEKVGSFREVSVKCNCSSTPPSEKAKEELATFNAEIQEKFGTTLAKFTQDKQEHFIVYDPLSEKQIESIFDYFSANLYAELTKAKNKDEKLIAICKFFRACEWLHPANDGSSRCNLLLFNFLLTQNGSHPTLMENYLKVNTLSFIDWIAYAQQGLKNWEMHST